MAAQTGTIKKAKASTPPFYEDTPLGLLTTPKFRNGKNDSFTQEASHMTLSHNSLIRGYNSIYQQAPRLPSSEYASFVSYCLAWHRLVETHHHYEELYFFPAIEEATGQKGVMDGEIEEHAAFHAGLESFKVYLESLQAVEKEFKPRRLLEIMDDFAGPLYAHLESEPKVLLSLSRFVTATNHFDLAAIGRETGKKSVSLDFVVNVMPCFLLNMEGQEFEGGMWRGFPELPGVARWILKVLVPLWHPRRWRFVACDSDGRKKRLVA
ncbi:hypothetical protein BP6252_12144 [Coleophoma cylindrospora]|uniref:Hemerythrin-like domain-containing protein n=1 Tax=Coleophoma cylindrospora TaxID=1849047 RepID=A0A3D8QGC2_9HELO|nr:hypothetical protein BP6252_12144 [Coleophoma cylindrospora]